jgi:hypothetical protein
MAQALTASGSSGPPPGAEGSSPSSDADAGDDEVIDAEFTTH